MLRWEGGWVGGGLGHDEWLGFRLEGGIELWEGEREGG